MAQSDAFSYVEICPPSGKLIIIMTKELEYVCQCFNFKNTCLVGFLLFKSIEISILT